MPIFHALQEDLKRAVKGRDLETARVLRFVLAQIHNREIEEKAAGKPELHEDTVREVLARELKKRKEAMELFEKGNRGDLAKNESREMRIISAYLPEPIPRFEIEAIVDDVIRRGAKEFGGVMKEAMLKLKGRADGRTVGEIVKAKLAARRA